jgi:hypothetical protein
LVSLLKKLSRNREFRRQFQTHSHWLARLAANSKRSFETLL